MQYTFSLAQRAILVASLIGLSACSSLPFFGKSDKDAGKENIAAYETNITALGVNGFLWRASLDTLSKLPLANTDAKGGTILTDWFESDAAPGERLKVDVYIMDDALRADALKVVVHRQVFMDGGWVAADVQANTAQQLEDTILVRARELRIRTLSD